jgi:hypothetical protein
MSGERGLVEFAPQPILVEAVEDAATEGLIAGLHGTTLPLHHPAHSQRSVTGERLRCEP